MILLSVAVIVLRLLTVVVLCTSNELCDSPKEFTSMCEDVARPLVDLPSSDNAGDRSDAWIDNETAELSSLIQSMTSEVKILTNQLRLLKTWEIGDQGPMSCIDAERNNAMLQEKIVHLSATHKNHLSNHERTVDTLTRLVADETSGRRLCQDELKRAADMLHRCNSTGTQVKLHHEVERLQEHVDHLHLLVTTTRVNRTLIAQDAHDHIGYLWYETKNAAEFIVDMVFLLIHTATAAACEAGQSLQSISKKMSQQGVMATPIKWNWDFHQVFHRKKDASLMETALFVAAVTIVTAIMLFLISRNRATAPHAQ